jgi:hypothetical protein
VGRAAYRPRPAYIAQVHHTATGNQRGANLDGVRGSEARFVSTLGTSAGSYAATEAANAAAAG